VAIKKVDGQPGLGAAQCLVHGSRRRESAIAVSLELHAQGEELVDDLLLAVEGSCVQDGDKGGGLVSPGASPWVAGEDVFELSALLGADKGPFR